MNRRKRNKESENNEQNGNSKSLLSVITLNMNILKDPIKDMEKFND
jgi:hypothetical protein